MNIFDNYIKLYPVSKTLSFTLLPQYETEENMKKYNILSKDELRASKYKEVKDLFDKYHKSYIESVLSKNVGVDWNNLYKILLESQINKDDSFKTESEKIRKVISKHLKSNNLYKSLAPAEIVKSSIKGEASIYKYNDEEILTIKNFDKFTTYFKGYYEARENIYSDKQGSVSYRLVNENFPKFVNNIKIFNSLEENLVNELKSFVKPLIDDIDLENIFTADGYVNVLNQSGIDFYNMLIGGISGDERTKIPGINEFLNLQYQKNKINKKLKLSPLFKQILSDRETQSFIPEALLTDSEVISSIKSFGSTLNEIIDDNIIELESVFGSETINSEKIYIDKKQVPFLSQLLYDNHWDTIRNVMFDKDIKEKSIYTLDLMNIITGKDILKEIIEIFKNSLVEMKCSYNNMLDDLNCERINDFDKIKKYLDDVQKSEKILKIFSVNDDIDKDSEFYPMYDLVYGALRTNVSVYNMVRNYATKKPYSTEKYKLNFENPTLADGWDYNKEYTYNTMLFIKDNKYYLGILNAKNKCKIKEEVEYTENSYKKLVYKLLPGPNKMLPKVFFSKKRKDIFQPSEYILNGYKAGKHKKGENFDINFCHDLIDYFKDSIDKHEDWSKFNFQFSETKDYKDIGEFYSEISAQNYKISFNYVNSDYMRELIKDGNIFLFQLYNKDFSEYSKGKENLHTLYWKQIFTDENINNAIFKLNGEAELFYRPESITNPFVHRKGTILISKNDINKSPVMPEIYESAVMDADSGLSVEELRIKYPTLVFKKAEYDIIKDRRYSKPSYSFHVPITINYGYKDVSRNINKNVLEDISWNKDVNIIGIDRGERNLIYVSVINQKGDIIEQKSFNTISNSVSKVDYHKKLDIIEKARDESRKNWKQISNIKEVKEGYLSAVVKEIADMMIKYNAIIAMEDLNFGFKRGRFHIEKQVYQKFEKMLIDKLNYFADKNKPMDEIGSIRYGYQLTPKFESFQKLGKQSGFLFYVPAAYTSKIDPKTGFVNLFTSQQLSYRSVDKSKEFINSFDSINYDSDYRCFRFKFRYSNFDLYKHDYKNEWEVYSFGENRIAYTKKNGVSSKEYVDVTDRLIKLFERYSIDYNKENIIEDICNVSDSLFFKELLWLFKIIVQIRYEDSNQDFILSPVLNNGTFFDSRKAKFDEPCDGDANGAYHIALQGLRILKSRIKNGKILSDGKDKQAYNWFEFVQKKSYRK